jgi:uncharacterized membrane protein YfhO
VLKDTANEMIVKVASEHSGLLVIPDNFDIGWAATVNGTSVMIERAFFAYRGVPVGRGVSEVRLAFEDRFLAIGLIVSAIALTALLASMIWDAQRRVRRNFHRPANG